MALNIDPEVNAAWGRLTSDSSPITWIMCSYPEGSSNQLVFLKEGENGMPEFLENLPPTEIIWGGFKVVGVDDRGNTVSRRPKFISVKYLPVEGVSTMKRARAGGHKGQVKQIMDAHIDIEIEAASELTEDVIIQKLRSSGGAHAPTSYEFHNFSS